MGMSKLGVFVKLNTSKLNFKATRSLIWVVFNREMSAFFCQACRKMLRCPVVKFVSNVSTLGTPLAALGVKSGNVKQDAFKAGWPGVTPFAPVKAFCGVQPLARLSGTIGLVMPSTFRLAGWPGSR